MHFHFRDKFQFRAIFAKYTPFIFYSSFQKSKPLKNDKALHIRSADLLLVFWMNCVKCPYFDFFWREIDQKNRPIRVTR